MIAGSRPTRINTRGGDDSWDEATPLLVGATLAHTDVRDEHCRFSLTRNGATHVLEVPADLSRLSVHGGSLEARRWRASDSLWDAWVVTEHDLYL